ncbi:MAG: DUF6797 domain-containing protein [Verrucomicrobiota bacterium]
MSFLRCAILVVSFSGLALVGEVDGQDSEHLALDSPFASFVEDDFPFFSQTVDARNFGDKPEVENLTPRGLVFPIGDSWVACFDPDLLRWALIWRADEDGNYLSMDGMAPGSYRLPNRKSSAGQDSLPRPFGTPVWANPILPGWGTGETPPTEDPRDRGTAEKGEVGLGPIPADQGRFSGIRLVEGGFLLEYEISGVSISETLRLFSPAEDGEPMLRRTIKIAPHEEPLHLQVGEHTHFLSLNKLSLAAKDGWAVLAPSNNETYVTQFFGDSRYALTDHAIDIIPADTPPPRRWEESVTVGETRAEPAATPLVFDDLAVPDDNPWKRNVRLGGFDFFPDGRAAFCTFDGDVWITSPIGIEQEEVTWSRFASGLHEPQSLELVDGVIQVFDRNGLVRLHDFDGNGEADWYENFNNTVTQTAETREFPMDMVESRGGSFFLAKGGQVGTTRGRENGTIVEVAPDGRSHTVTATGLRQPYLGYNRELDLLTATDQQGHWKPATPVYRIEEGAYYGFQPAKQKDEAIHPAAIELPGIWIPHFINGSAAGQIWTTDSTAIGPFTSGLIHIGYNRPELFEVLLDESGKQGAVVSLISGFPSGILKARINPVDRHLYAAGFEIWGTSANRITGLFRIRPTGEPSWAPELARAEKRGVRLRFRQKLDPAQAGLLTGYSVERWNYRQTHNYGSGNFKLDGTPGQESLPVASVLIDEDERGIFLGIPDMRPSDALRITYRIPAATSTAIESVFLSVFELEEIDLTTAGFSTDQVDLKIDATLAQVADMVEATPELGAEIAMRYGCIACHATDPNASPAPGAQVQVGPAWHDLWGKRREFTDGSFIRNADAAYLRESILNPGIRVAEGYAMQKTGVGMPSYLGVLKEHEIDSIIYYIESLAKKK